MTPPDNGSVLQRNANLLAIAAARVGNYCDHAEHNEIVERSWVLDSGTDLIACSFDIAASFDDSPVERYAERLGQIEAANVLYGSVDFRGADEVRAAKTWKGLQLVQARHDRFFHPDVAGMSRADQLRHYAFHLAKLAGAVAESCLGTGDADSLRQRRVPDMLLFGIKLHTAVAAPLPDEPLESLWWTNGSPEAPSR